MKINRDEFCKECQDHRCFAYSKSDIPDNWLDEHGNCVERDPLYYTWCDDCAHQKYTDIANVYCTKYNKDLDYYDGPLVCEECRNPINRFINGFYLRGKP